MKGNTAIKDLTVSIEDLLILSLNRDDFLNSDEDLNFGLEEDNNKDSAEKLQNTLLMMRNSTVCEQFFKYY